MHFCNVSVIVTVCVWLSLLLVGAELAISSICVCWKQLRGVLLFSGKRSGVMEGVFFCYQSNENGDHAIKHKTASAVAVKSQHQ